MAMYVVLRYENDEDANDFITATVSRKLWREVDVVGMYKAPTQFCDGLCGRKHKTGWTRGQKWGWWVCPVCGKPGAYTADLHRVHMNKNLLTEEPT